MADPTKPDISEGSIGAPVEEAARSWGGFGKGLGIVIKILLALLVLYLVTHFVHWFFPEPGTTRWNVSNTSSGQPAVKESAEVVVITTNYLTREFGINLYGDLKDGERVVCNPIGARVVFYCITANSAFTVTNGPIGTPWFKPINIDAAMVYAKLADEQPQGLIPLGQPFIEKKVTRTVTVEMSRR